MLLDIPPDLVEFFQIGVDEPFPDSMDKEDVKRWYQDNQHEMNFVARTGLEDILEPKYMRMH